MQVMEQPCNCLAFAPVHRPKTKTTLSTSDNNTVIAHTAPGDDDEANRPLPHIAAGYGDGTVRMFDLNRVEMVLKMQPHAASVTAICFSADG